MFKFLSTITLISCVSSVYATDLEPIRLMPNQVPNPNQTNKFKVNFGYSFDEQQSTAATTTYQHNLRFKLSLQRFHNQWLKDFNFETFQKHNQNNQNTEQYLNSFKLAKYKNDLNYRFAKAQWEKDDNNNYDSLSSLTFGLGRDIDLWQSSSLSGEFGLGYRYSEGANIDELSKNETLATFGLFFQHKFNPMIGLEQNFSYELGQNNNIFRGKSALNVSLNEHYFAQASYHIKRQDDPLNTNIDSKVLVGIEYHH